MSKRWRGILVLLSMTLVFAIALGTPPRPTSAGFTPTPAVEDGDGEDGDWEDCTRRLIISVGGDVPDGLVISGWTAFDPTEMDMPTGAKEFDIPWSGKPFDVGFAEGTLYRIWGWTDEGGWMPLFDFESTECGDQYREYTFGGQPTATTAATDTPVPTSTPQPELPETGGGGGWLLWPIGLAVALLAFAFLHWRRQSVT